MLFEAIIVLPPKSNQTGGTKGCGVHFLRNTGIGIEKLPEELKSSSLSNRFFDLSRASVDNGSHRTASMILKLGRN